jgi:hypothetical protein
MFCSCELEWVGYVADVQDMSGEGAGGVAACDTQDAQEAEAVPVQQDCEFGAGFWHCSCIGSSQCLCEETWKKVEPGIGSVLVTDTTAPTEVSYEINCAGLWLDENGFLHAGTSACPTEEVMLCEKVIPVE